MYFFYEKWNNGAMKMLKRMKALGAFTGAVPGKWRGRLKPISFLDRHYCFHKRTRQ